jgi:metal-responsive CopG/Arc/MetJ family transcriptional regulator
VLSYDANMPVKPVQISIDTKLLRRIDAQPETRKRGRSAFVRTAVETYLHAKERREIDEAIGAAYGAAADAMLAEVEDLLDAQAWPAK